MSFGGILGSKYETLRPKGGCHSCPRKRRGFVPATLTDAELIVVGEGPGRIEVEEGEGWVGPAGRHLAAEFEEAGLPAFDKTNAIHCRPPSNRRPNDRELAACLNQYVAEEVRGYPFVVLAGNTAISTFYPGVRPSKLRGNVAVHPDFPGQRFYSTYHPSWAIRDSRNRGRFSSQIRRLGRVLEEPFGTPWDLLTASSAGAWERYEEILEEPVVSFDLETDGVEVWDPTTRILSLAVTVDNEDAVFWHHEDDEWEDALAAFGRFMEKRDRAIVGHNIGFDVTMMERRSGYSPVNRARVLDTMPLLYLAEQERQIGLKQAAARYLDGYRFLVHAPHRCKDVRALGNYNSEDVVRSLELLRLFLPRLRTKTRDLYLRVSSPTSVSLARVEADGIGYSMETARELRDYTRELREAELDAWRQEDPSLDLRYEDGDAVGDHAGDGLRTYMYGEEFLALPAIKYTETEKPAADKDTIKTLVRDHEAAAPLRHLLEIRRLDKQESTYVTPYLTGKNTSPDGRVHSSYTYCYTDTGRPSSRSPNLQNITRPSRDYRVNVRDCFVARDGCLLVQWDFSQIELRIGMCLAEDPVGIAAYRAGEDLHTATGKVLARMAGRDEMTKEDRQNAKPTNFTMIYAHTEGAWHTLRQQAYRDYGIEMSEAEAKEYRDTWLETYERIPAWHEREVARLRSGEGEFTSVLGHTAYYPDYAADAVPGFRRMRKAQQARLRAKREHAERAAINMTCQGPAAYITFYTMALAQAEVLDRRELRENVLWANTVYDSVMLDAPPEHVPELQGIMERSVARVADWISDWFVVPLVIDRSEGPDWGHLVEVEE